MSVVVFLGISMVMLVPALGRHLTIRTYQTDWALIDQRPHFTAGADAIAAITALVLVFTTLVIGWDWRHALMVCPLLAVALHTDLVGRVIPDVLNIAIFTVGLALTVLGLNGDPLTVLATGVGLSIAAPLFHAIVSRRFGAGAFCLGDVKFIMACGFAVPAAYIAWSFIFAAPIAVACLKLTPSNRRDVASTELPFGTLFVAGTAVTTCLIATSFTLYPANAFLWSLGF